MFAYINCNRDNDRMQILVKTVKNGLHKLARYFFMHTDERRVHVQSLWASFVLTSLVFAFMFLLFSCQKQAGEVPFEPKDPVYPDKSAKRGVSFTFQQVDDMTLLAPGISWSYNWGSAQNETFDAYRSDYGLDYCPMAWNGVNESAIREYVERNPDCSYLLAFNEPNLTDQANMTPTQAAENWPALKSLADELGLQIISPAMNYGTLEDYSDPIVWLDEFFTLVPESDIAGLAIHCYMSNAGALKSYVERFKKYNKPIWLTEFCAWENSVTAESQQQFMVSAVNYLESDPDVFRYAWFIPRGSGSEDAYPYMFLLKSASSELTSLGQVYTQLSAQDTSVYYVENQTIEAENYSAVSVSESVGQEGWTKGPQVCVTSEAPNESLELYNFFTNYWVEYQVELAASKSYDMQIRYASFTDSQFLLTLDGDSVTTFSLENTNQNYLWQTASIPIPLKEGKHTLRFTQQMGTVCLNWFSLIY